MATLMFDRDEKGVGLARLNEAERQVLLLLAEGHTAKSVATELGSTPAAVNERLREARRKTGVGSSRELARLLKSQENRHDEMGVAKAFSLDARAWRSGADPRRQMRKVFAMIGLTAILLTAAAVLASDQAPVAANEIDPMIGQRLPKFADPAEFHAKVRMETRDPDWASRTETAIKARVTQIPLIGEGDNEIRVLCGRTLCEIAGTLLAPPKSELDDQNSQYSRTVQALQVPPLPDDLAKLGLKHESGLFTGAKGKPDRSLFLLYYSRKE